MRILAYCLHLFSSIIMTRKTAFNQGCLHYHEKLFKIKRACRTSLRTCLTKPLMFLSKIDEIDKVIHCRMDITMGKTNSARSRRNMHRIYTQDL